MNYVFDPAWFKKHQKGLLFLLNAPVIKYWFRWVLRINSVRIFWNRDTKKFKIERTRGISFKEKIIELQPNNYKIYAGLKYFLKSELLKTASENRESNKYTRRIARAMLRKIRIGRIEDELKLLPTITANFRTHVKFSKRLYHAFYPLWVAFHIWDLFADYYAPNLSFGFSTLTVYPDAGTGATTVDGTVEREPIIGENWATIRAGAGSAKNATQASGQFYRMIGSVTADTFGILDRSIYTFDTSPLGAGATISAATISFYGSSVRTDAASPTAQVVAATPAANNALANADYGQLGSTAFSTAIAAGSWSTSAYNDFALNTNGKANISKTGVSGFGGIEGAYDLTGTDPGDLTNGGTDYANCYNADQAGTTNDPKLVVTYTSSVASTLTMVQGSFTLSGQVLGFMKVMHLTMAQASFTLTGIATVFIRGRTLVMAQGSFVLTGISNTLTKAMHLTMAQASFALTGISLTFSKAMHLTMSVGQFTVTGIAMIIKGAWGYLARNVANWVDNSKHSSNWTDQNKS